MFKKLFLIILICLGGILMFDSVTHHNTKITHSIDGDPYTDYGYNYQINMKADYLNPFTNKNVKGKKLNVEIVDSNNNSVKEFNMITDKNGNAQELISELPLGVYTLKTSFVGDGFFNPSFREDKFTLKKVPDDVTKSVESASVSTLNSSNFNDTPENFYDDSGSKWTPSNSSNFNDTPENFYDDTGPNWTRLPYVTDDKNIIRQELDYDCSCNSIQLAYYGITGRLVDESKIVNYVYGNNSGGGANASMIQKGIDGLNNDYGTDVHIKWMNTTEIGGLDGVAKLYLTGEYAVFQNLPNHFQVIRGINTKNKILTIYSSLNSTTSTSGLYDTEPGVYVWSFDRDYNLINRQSWSAWAVLKIGDFPNTIKNNTVNDYRIYA
jgi:hypothetical protein